MNERERIKFLALQAYVLKVQKFTAELFENYFSVEETEEEGEDGGGHEIKSL